MSQQILNLSIILAVTTALVLFLRMFKQPPLASYILAGLVLGPSVLNITPQTQGLETLGHLGIAFLLFIVGLNLDVRSLKRVGAIATSAGIAQVMLTAGIGFLLALAVGLSTVASVYVGIALAFSSTIIVVKLLTDRREVDSLHGRISIGFLIVQDLFAVLALMFVSTFSTDAGSSLLHTVGLTLIKGVSVGLLAWGVQVYLLPSLVRAAGKSQEVLFLFSITWCFAFAGIFDLLGFSLEIGALIAGLMLASTQYSYEIASKIKPLRDFFIILFFIILGSQMQLSALNGLIIPALIISAAVLVGKPLLITGLMGYSGFTKRTSVKVGWTLGQISEFSLILLTLGVSVGHIPQSILNMVTLVGLITFLASGYIGLHIDGFYNKLHATLPFYRRGVHHHEHRSGYHMKPYDIILFGHNRAGESIVEHFVKNEKNFLTIDFDPDTVSRMQKAGHNALLADADDAELYSELRLDEVQTVVSTITDVKTNQLILSEVRAENSDATVILTAHNPEDGLLLYEEGADYVIVPHMLGGDHAAVMLDMVGKDFETFLERKALHLEQLKQRQ